MPIDYKDMGSRIKRKREDKGLSQAELASQTELSTQHISNVENARSKIGLDKLVSIANVLECSVDELVCGSMKVVRTVYNSEIASIIEDYSDIQLRVLPDYLRYFNYAYEVLKHEMEEEADSK